MAWWRRDPSLFSRSPIHRYAQRLLRNHEAALCTRYFSRTSSKAAQHEYDDSSKRPAGMSNLEWMQLQHYKKWRKRLQDDPYQAIFGASNDMLRGRGLRDWEWVYKSFPKWMLREMDETPRKDIHERKDGHSEECGKRSFKGEDPTARSTEEQSISINSTYPKKVEIIDENHQALSPRTSHFPQPSYRATHFERDGGVASPSDLRRAREGSSYVKVVSTPSNRLSREPLDASAARGTTDISSPSMAVAPEPQKGFNATIDQVAVENPRGGQENEISRKETTVPESSFVNEFLVDKPQSLGPDAGDHANAKAWRQTVLQRRSSSELMAKPNTKSSLAANDRSDDASQVSQVISEPPGRKADDGASDYQMSEVRDKVKFIGWLMEQEKPRASQEVKQEDSPPSTRPTSEILNQLPKDDIDFLSAADIRASMGTRRSKLPSNEEREAERQKLEQTFASAQEVDHHLDTMIESKIINDQLVRRTERELREAELAQEVKETQPAEEPVSRTPAEEPPTESSIDRMKRWLETTGASFAKQFWQDPTEEVDVTKTRLFFDKVMHYIRKGRVAMQPIVEDLEKDVPASIPLLKRLKSDEDMLELAIHRLRQRSASGLAQGLTPRKIKAMESLKVRFHQTNKELEKAYEALREITTTGAVTGATGSYKRRLCMASKVLNKNAQLSRMLIYSLQTRLEDPNVDRKILSNYKPVADNLLSLRDTQMTLIRLVDHAMLIYGVAPKTMETSDVVRPDGLDGKNVQFDYANCDEPSIRARLAADALLVDQIKAHNSDSQSLFDDGGSSISKVAPRTGLDEPKPLTHSLFRPFGAAKWGNDDWTTVPWTTKAEEEAKQKRDDLKLVAEIKKAYEDTYGAITVDHRQTAPETEAANKQEDETVQSFEMLKEDPAVTTDYETIPKLVNTKTLCKATEATTPSQEDAIVPVASTHTPSVPEGPKETIAMSTEARTAGSEVLPTATLAVTPSSTPEVKPEVTSTDAASPSTTHLPTHYTILVHDPQTDALSITTSITGPPRDTSPALPLHQALASLESPAKFIPYITQGLEVVTAKKDMLVLRDALDDAASTRWFETVKARSNVEEKYPEARSTVNPIDGTARLSPTGYVGPEESPEQLQKEFDERRRAARKFNATKSPLEEVTEQQEEAMKKKRRGGAGSVVKTAIWAAAVCYVVGVFGEIANAPFKM